MTELVAMMKPNDECTRVARSPSPVTSAPMGFRSVLVPVDLTAGSDRVLGRLALLPLADDARVTLLHVVPASLPASDQRRIERDAGKALAGEARHLRKLLHAKVRVEHSVRVGAVTREIAERAQEVHADLIVMGRGNGHPLRDSLLGSTAERVIRQARLSVLVVRLAARAVYSRPALAVDLDRAARDVVPLMMRVLQRPRPHVDVIHAFTVPYMGLIYPSLSDVAANERLAELRSDAALEVLELLASATARAGVRADDELVWKTHVEHGSPRAVVEKAIAKAETDLLVLGTRAHSGAAFVFWGTVAGDLLRAVKCDVLVVPPSAARD